MKLIKTEELVKFFTFAGITFTEESDDHFTYMVVDGEVTDNECFALGARFNEWMKNQK